MWVKNNEVLNEVMNVKQRRTGIRTKIMSGYIVLIICLVLASIVLNEQITTLQKERNELISYDVALRSTAQQLEKDVLLIDNYVQRYRLTNDPYYLQQYERHRSAWQVTHNKLVDIAGEREQETLHIIEDHIITWLSTLNMPSTSEQPARMTAANSEALFEQFEKQFAAFYVRQDEIVVEKVKSLDHANRFLAINLFVVLALTALITMLLFGYIASKIVKSVRQVTTAIGQMATNRDRQQRVVATTNDEVRDLVDATNTLITTMKNEQWLQTNIAQTMSAYQGAKTIEELANIVLQQMTMRTKSACSTFYMKQSIREQPFTIVAAIALKESADVKGYKHDELITACIDEKRPVSYRKDGPVTYTQSIRDVALDETYALPILFEQDVVAVIVFSSFSTYMDEQRLYMEQLASQLGVTIDYVKSRMHVEQLLQESQALTDELKMQSHVLAEQAQTLTTVNTELANRTREAEYKSEVLEETKRTLQQKAVELQQASTYKSAFLANMSHELRTPLNSILVLSELLQHENNEDAAQYAHVIHESGEQLLTIINDILDLSKVEAGKMELTVAPLSINELAGRLRSTFEPVAVQKGLALHITANAAGVLYTDEKRLLQIMNNLVGNALKFTEHGTVHVDMTRTEQDALRIVVQDSGIGIPESKQQMIFESFQQADSATIRQYGGTGLGLAICREFTKLLSGTITVKSEEGVGSTFTVTLPNITM